MSPLFIENFLPKQILNLCYSYCIIKFSNQKKFKLDVQTSTLAYENSDYLMETIMDLSTPVVEKNVGKKLYPTYSFLRVYDKGSDLKIHIDRESCEYTVALCLGSYPKDKSYEIFLGEEDDNSDYKYFDSDGNYKRVKIDHKFKMIENNAVIFQGMDKLHWREECYHDHYITVFLHYVDQDGHYKEFKYDKRKQLGQSYF